MPYFRQDVAPASPKGVALPEVLPPLLKPVEGEAPRFQSALQEEKHFEKKSVDMNIAVKKVATLVALAVQAYTGNLPGLFSNMACNAEQLTLDFGASKSNSGMTQVFGCRFFRPP
jgi:hypothetical protein